MQKQKNFAESGPGAGVGTSAANKVKRGDIRHAIVVRTAKKLQRPDGSVVKFDDNACVLINKAGEPIGTRLNGMLQGTAEEVLTNCDQVSLVQNYEKQSGRRFCRWHRCICRVTMGV